MPTQLEEVVSKSLLIDRSQVTEDLQYNSIPEWDSVAHMVLVADLEDAYGLMLETDDIVSMSSVGKIRDVLKKYDVEP